MFGAFIVHKRPPVYPYHVMTVQDWFPVDANALRVMNPYDPTYRGTGEQLAHVNERYYSADGNELSAFQYHTTLIGGRGRRDKNETLPLATYDVTAGGRVRFSVLNTGAEFSYEISVDSHELWIMALDGHEIHSKQVDYFIISPAERVDFEIETNQPVSTYWIRAYLLRHSDGLPLMVDDVIEGGMAILRYQTATQPTESDPETTPRSCNEVNPCVVFNCPFLGYPADKHKGCLTLDNATSAYSSEHLQALYGIHDTNYEEYFLNWGYHIGSSVNGRKFSQPTAPYSENNANNVIPCSDAECENGCYCTFTLTISANRTIQLVMSNLQHNSPFLGHHAMHLHGHSFAVMAMGFPDYNTTTGVWTRANDDVICDTDLCAHVSWNGQRPQLNDVNPVVRDSFLLPSRGYAVIRFRYAIFRVLVTTLMAHILHATQPIVLVVSKELHKPESKA